MGEYKLHDLRLILLKEYQVSSKVLKWLFI